MKNKIVALLLAVLMALFCVPAMAETTPVTGGTFLVNGQEHSTCFLPYSSTTSDRFNNAPAIECLGRVNPETGITEGWLAESFEADFDTLTLTIKLREGIQFSDGSDFNADAVIWNFEKMAEYGKTSELSSATSWEKIDDYTIVMHFDAWANDWVDIIGQVYIYCPAAFEANGLDWAATHPVGTGPFVLEEFVQDSHMIYVRNENYWIEGQPYLDSIRISQVKDGTTQLSAFINGELDILQGPTSVAIEQLMGKYENIAGGDPDQFGLCYMMPCSGDENSPFYDVRVRQALMHAVDWEGLAVAIYGELGGTTPVFAVPGSWAYDESVEQYSYDLEEAKRLLTEAGYPNGFDTVITVNDNSQISNDAAVIMQAFMAEIGINAEIKVITSADFNAQKAEGVYDYGVMINTGSSKKDFVANYIRLYSSEGVNYKNMMAKPADYEEALFGARAATTQEEKETLLKKAATLLSHDYALVIALGYTRPVCFSNGKVHDTGMGGSALTLEKAWKE